MFIGDFPPEQSDRGVDYTTYRLAEFSRMHGFPPPTRHVFSWRSQRQIFLTLYVSMYQENQLTPTYVCGKGRQGFGDKANVMK
jgi:hypothetical protein